MTPDNDLDIALMTRAGAGDDQAFAELVSRHERGLVNFFRRLGVHMEQTEDLVQDTLLKLHRARGAWKPQARFTTFLYTLARHTRIDWLRKLEREHVLTGVLPEESLPPGIDTTEQTAAEMDLQVLLERLSDRHREVVVLAAVQKFKYAEIADILEIPIGTVRSRLHQAMKRLTELAEETKWSP